MPIPAMAPAYLYGRDLNMPNKKVTPVDTVMKGIKRNEVDNYVYLD
jgi:hypothetical protein